MEEFEEFSLKIEQLKQAKDEGETDIMEWIIETLLTSTNGDTIFHVDTALSYRTNLFMKYVVQKDEEHEIRENLEELVECLLEYNEIHLNNNEDDWEEDWEEWEDNLLDYHKNNERKSFGRGYIEGNAKGYEYRELDEEDWDY